MKKILILTLLLCLILVSCDKENEPAGEKVIPVTKEEQTVSTPGYTFDFKGVSVALDAKMEPVANALGEPSSYFESQSCAFQGLDKVYGWGSVVIRTYPEDGVDYILSIELKDDSVSTPEGVSIGDTLESAKAVYGEPTEESASAVIYKKGNTTLTFLASEGEINAITYTKNA